MAGIFDIKKFTNADWSPGSQASIDDGTNIATINGIGGPVPNRVTSVDQFTFEVGVAYQIRVNVLTAVENTAGSRFDLFADAQQLSIDFEDIVAGEVNVFNLTGSGNTTTIVFQGFRVALTLESPFGGDIVPSGDPIPKNYLEGDVLLYQTDNDGEINMSGGVIEMTGDFRTAVYLSMFGGNVKDDTRNDNKFNWWGNISETDNNFKYRSETQYLLESLPLTSSNLLKVEDAMVRDLDWMLNMGIASSINVDASIPKVNKIKTDISIEANGEEFNFTFIENWRAGVEQ